QPAGQPPGGRAEQERMVRVEDVEVEAAHLPPDARRPRHRQRELRIRRGGNRREADDPRIRLGGAGEARRKRPHLVAPPLQPAPERLHRDRDATTERQVVVGEQPDPHAPPSPQALLYFSKSSGLMFCSHSRSCSGSSAFIGSPSLATSILPALGNTSSSTKMGAATRSASAMASDGRESTVYSAPPSLRWSTAKNVFSLRSVTTTFTTWASSDSRMFLMRSCVICRAVAIFSSSSAMALASKIPTQIGSDRLSSSSRKMMIRMFETGSRASP